MWVITGCIPCSPSLQKLKRILYFSCRGLSKTAVELSVTTDYKYNTGELEKAKRSGGVQAWGGQGGPALRGQRLSAKRSIASHQHRTAVRAHIAT